jgi:hypothetical protein
MTQLILDVTEGVVLACQFQTFKGGWHLASWKLKSTPEEISTILHEN